MLLEPMMDVEVVVPEEYMGDVMGDLTSRSRGKIQRNDSAGPVRRLLVPSCPIGGNVRLRHGACGRLTRVARSYTMHFAHYEYE